MKYILVAAVVLLFSCKEEKKQTLPEKQKEIESGSIDSANQYQAPEIGWSATIPAGWEVQSKKESDAKTERGKNEIEKATGVQIEASGMHQLLNLKKDKFNSFISTMEPFSESEMGPYVENNKKVAEVIMDTYRSNNLHAVQTEDSTMLDGLLFYILTTKIHSPDKSKVLLTQIMYSRLINGYDVGFTISYNNDDSFRELENMMRTSKFTVR